MKSGESFSGESPNAYQPSSASQANRRQRAVVLQSLAIVGVAVTGIIAWHLIAVGFKLPSALLPRPLEVFQASYENRAKLLQGFLITGLAAAAGLVAAVAIGSLISVAFSQSRRVRLAFFPYIVFLQTVPIVAIAPLLIIWSGYEFRTVVIVTVIVCLFPIVNNVTAGLTTVDRQLSDLFSLYGSGRAKRLVKLQWPAAIPALVIGVKTSSGLAVIGAIVAEFFVGSGSDYEGLGTLMTLWQGRMATDALIGAVFASTALGLILFGAVELVSRTLLRRWTR
ncbi:MAG: ABC transporter permease subunit [Planctomycetota bacterium]